NEIAQSEGAGKKFARFWIHNGLLTINKEKMAKSLGNFVTIEEVLNKYPADVLKILFLQAHYSKPVDFSWERMEEAKKAGERFYILLDKLNRLKTEKSSESCIDVFRKRFEDAMDDDFNTAEALAVLFDLVTHVNKLDTGSVCAKDLLLELGGVLGLFGQGTVKSRDVKISEKEIKKLIDLRNMARKNKDFKAADKIREDLDKKGIILEDEKSGTTWRVK
ncbi:MAG: class I tRNA ligase family protein, partial [Candidatus Omnitrophica bacterium]|nr:class I tRNA ligase family protein [Candidatus Omnitrophota bacterium]